MKRFGKMISILLLAVLLGAMILPLGASADVIYTPLTAFMRKTMTFVTM